MVADQIADSGAPVIMDPIYNLPTAFEHLGARLENAANTYEKGVGAAYLYRNGLA